MYREYLIFFKACFCMSRKFPIPVSVVYVTWYDSSCGYFLFSKQSIDVFFAANPILNCKSLSETEQGCEISVSVLGEEDDALVYT